MSDDFDNSDDSGNKCIRYLVDQYQSKEQAPIQLFSSYIISRCLSYLLMASLFPGTLLLYFPDFLIQGKLKIPPSLGSESKFTCFQIHDAVF